MMIHKVLYNIVQL